MSSLGEDNTTASSGSETRWACPSCTLINEADANVCSICDRRRPSTAAGRISDKGKARRRLRPRASTPPPAIGTYSEPEYQDKEDEEDGRQEAHFMLPDTEANEPNSSRKARAKIRGGGRGGQEGDGSSTKPDDRVSAVASGSGQRATSALRDATGVTDACSAGPALEPYSGASRKPLEVDNSDEGEHREVRCSAPVVEHAKDTRDEVVVHDDPVEGEEETENWGEQEEGAREEEDMMFAGEFPVLLGRGWSDEDRERAMERRRTRDRELGSGSGGGNGSGGWDANRKRRGNQTCSPRARKRSRPLPTRASDDDIFRARKYAAEDVGSAGAGGLYSPLLTRRKRRSSKQCEEQPFWRWPPPPRRSSRAVEPSLADDDECSQELGDGASSVVAEHSRESGPGDGSASAFEGEAEVGSCGAGGGCGTSHRPSLATKAGGFVDVKAGPSAEVEVEDQHSRRPKKKRSRLSLPKRPDGDPRTSSTGNEHQGLAPATARSVGHTGDDDCDGGPKDTDAANRPAEDVLGAPFRHERLPAARDDDVSKAAAGITPGGSVTEALSRGSIHERSDKAEEGQEGQLDRGARAQKSPSPSSPTGRDHERSEEVDGGNDQQEGVATVTDTRRASSAIGVPNVMPYDMGSDSDSSSGSETQDEAQVARKRHHRDRAKSEAPEDDRPRSPIPTLSSTPHTPKSTPTSSPIPGLGTANGIRTAASNRATPPVEERKQAKEPRASIDDSQEASPTGLVDTPPSATPPRAGQTRSLKRKLYRSSREADMLMGSSPGSDVRSRQTWACASCTFENRARAKVCKMCSSQKQITPAGTKSSASAHPYSTINSVVDEGNCDQAPAKGVPASEGTASDGTPSEQSTSPVKGESARKERAVLQWRGHSVQHTGDMESENADGKTVETRSLRSSGARSLLADARSTSDAAMQASAEAASARSRGASRGVEVFVGNRRALADDSDEDDAEVDEGDEDDDCLDADYEDGEVDNEEDPEAIGTQIEEMFLRCSQGTPPKPRGARSPRRRRRQADVTEAFCDLTEITEDKRPNGVTWNEARRKGAPGEDGRSAVEEISDDETDEDNRDHDDEYSESADEVFAFTPSDRASAAASDLRTGNGQRRHAPAPRKYRFFSSVKEHRDRQTSSVDFAALAAAPAGESTRTRDYEARKKAREAKAKRTKRGKGKKSRELAGRGRKAKHGKGDSRGDGAGGGSKSVVRPFGGTGGVPSASWIPRGVAAGLSTAARGRRACAEREPFNHYRGNDQMVDDSVGGGGVHWEGIGRTSFGD